MKSLPIYIALSTSLILGACSTPGETPIVDGSNNTAVISQNGTNESDHPGTKTDNPSTRLEAKKQKDNSRDANVPSFAMVDKITASELSAAPAAELREKVAEQSGQGYSVAPQRKVEAEAVGTLMPRAIDLSQLRAPSEPLNRENYQHFDNNPVKLTQIDPLSTFSIDVDTASYSNVRRMVQNGVIPPGDAVRVEEFVNYFDYHYPAPSELTTPFNVTTEIGPSPWAKDRYLLHIGLQGYTVPENQRPPVNLVFLIDVSGSMQATNKLPLLKKSLAFLTQQLRAEDHVAMVVYAGASGLVLPSTPGTDKAKILSALDQLQAGGSTNGAAGIYLAYEIAMQQYHKQASNLILLATDGDFNVGTTNFQQLVDLIKEKRQSGVAISTLGFGDGNYNDHLAEQIADAGNGTASYIDSLQEAHKVLVENIGSALIPIARDTKAQIEFNPQWVSEYRLIGYENRSLQHHEFNMDSVDAGDLFSGHNVTALYEIALVGNAHPGIDPLRYGKTDATVVPKQGELAFLKLRYKPIGSEKSILVTTPILSNSIQRQLANTSDAFKFSASVAAYGQMLRHSPYVSQMTLQQVITLAQQGKGQDPDGSRAEFINQVSLVATLRHEPVQRLGFLD